MSRGCEISTNLQEFLKLFFAQVVSHQKKFEIEEPRLPQKRRTPARIKNVTSSGDFHAVVQDYFIAIYFLAAVNCITDRFDQRGYSFLW